MCVCVCVCDTVRAKSKRKVNWQAGAGSRHKAPMRLERTYRSRAASTPRFASSLARTRSLSAVTAASRLSMRPSAFRWAFWASPSWRVSACRKWSQLFAIIDAQATHKQHPRDTDGPGVRARRRRSMTGVPVAVRRGRAGAPLPFVAPQFVTRHLPIPPGGERRQEGVKRRRGKSSANHHRLLANTTNMTME